VAKGGGGHRNIEEAGGGKGTGQRPKGEAPPLRHGASAPRHAARNGARSKGAGVEHQGPNRRDPHGGPARGSESPGAKHPAVI